MVKPAKHNILLILNISILVVTLIVSGVFYISIHKKTEVSYVNVNKIVTSFIAKQKDSDMSEDELAEKCAVFMNKLDLVLENIAKETRTVIIVSDAIIKGGIDLTRRVENEILH